MSEYPTVWAYEQACAALETAKADRDHYRAALEQADRRMVRLGGRGCAPRLWMVQAMRRLNGESRPT